MTNTYDFSFGVLLQKHSSAIAACVDLVHESEVLDDKARADLVAALQASKWTLPPSIGRFDQDLMRQLWSILLFAENAPESSKIPAEAKLTTAAWAASLLINLDLISEAVIESDFFSVAVDRIVRFTLLMNRGGIKDNGSSLRDVAKSLNRRGDGWCHAICAWLLLEGQYEGSSVDREDAVVRSRDAGIAFTYMWKEHQDTLSSWLSLSGADQSFVHL